MFEKPKRFIHSVFIHCSASDNHNHDKIAVIDDWHREKGYECKSSNVYKHIGYHYFIDKAGTVFAGRDLEAIPAAQAPYNTGSIAICVSGLKHFTPNQYNSLIMLCNSIDSSYNYPIRFRGHCEVANKLCPVFDYKKVLDLDEQGYIRRKAWYNGLLTVLKSLLHTLGLQRS